MHHKSGGPCGAGIPRCRRSLRFSGTGDSAALLSDFVRSDSQGLIGGAHAGYNYQFSQWVIGLEGTIDGSSLNKTAVGFPGSQIRLTSQFREQSLALVVAFDRALIYATGGAAIADVSNTYAANIIAPVAWFVSGKISHTRFGWTVGGGLNMQSTTIGQSECNIVTRILVVSRTTRQHSFPSQEVCYL